ncbi:hypothetical protein [Deinococcus actinosclerus]|uniref:hypothetical protein n=1 Tax=Deinococcus actinosclerus TaxID=1768108 RepID=UPI0012FB5E3B|nr:hypothetical protein [Deinococcus actinosclerus]
MELDDIAAVMRLERTWASLLTPDRAWTTQQLKRLGWQGSLMIASHEIPITLAFEWRSTQEGSEGLRMVSDALPLGADWEDAFDQAVRRVHRHLGYLKD